jgi:hypothetical protein
MGVYSVARGFRKIFQSTARNPDNRLSSAGYEHIRVDIHMPLFNIQSPGVLSPNRILSNAVMIGSTAGHDYVGTFSDLNASLHGAPIRLSINLNCRTSSDFFFFHW